jgi:phage tail protein X
VITILKETVKIEGLTVANIIWRKFNRQPEGFVAKVFDINPGLAEYAEVPVGTVIAFPVEALAEAKAKRDVIRLWD